MKRKTIKRLLFCSDNSDNFIDLTHLSTTSLCNLQENSAQDIFLQKLLEYYCMLLVCANAVLLTPQYFHNPKDGLLHIEQTGVVNPDTDSDWIRIHGVPRIRTEEDKMTQKIENG